MAMPEITDYPISEDVKGVLTLMQTVKAKVEAVYLANGVPLPSRRYYTFGLPAYDCEQMVVSFVQAYLGQPGNQASDALPCNSPRSAVLSISVVRKTATPGKQGTTPSAEKIQEASDWQAIDAGTLLDAIGQFNDWGDGIPGLGVIATVAAEEASGGYASMTMQLTVGIPT